MGKRGKMRRKQGTQIENKRMLVKKKLQIREKERIMIGKAEGEKIMAAMNFIFSPCL